MAERIIGIAEKRGIPVFRDDSAVSLLCMLEVGANIPEELYEVVATIYGQILATAAKLKGEGPETITTARIQEALHDRKASGTDPSGN